MQQTFVMGRIDTMASDKSRARYRGIKIGRDRRPSLDVCTANPAGSFLFSERRKCV